VGHGLALGRRAHEALTALGEGHDGRRGARALGVLDDGRFAALQYRHARVGRAKIDSDGLAHRVLSFASETASAENLSVSMADHSPPVRSISVAPEPFDAPESRTLRREVEVEMVDRYGGDQEQGVKPNRFDVATFLVARDPAGRAVGCGAL